MEVRHRYRQAGAGGDGCVPGRLRSRGGADPGGPSKTAVSAHSRRLAGLTLGTRLRKLRTRSGLTRGVGAPAGQHRGGGEVAGPAGAGQLVDVGGDTVQDRRHPQRPAATSARSG